MAAIEVANQPRVWIDKQLIQDYSTRGPITQNGIRSARDLAVKDGSQLILVFHDHPDEMGINDKYKALAEKCSREGWLTILSSAS